MFEFRWLNVKIVNLQLQIGANVRVLPIKPALESHETDDKTNWEYVWANKGRSLSFSLTIKSNESNQMKMNEKINKFAWYFARIAQSINLVSFT